MTRTHASLAPRRCLVRLAFAFACCAHASSATPATPPPAVVARQSADALARATRSDGPGAVVLVARGDAILYRDARGLADIELGVPLQPGHVFRIASVTKIFTAAMVVQLADAGALSLDDELGMHIADAPDAARVTLRQLLDHTGGISDVPRAPQPGFSRRDVDTATRIADIRLRPLDFPPGSRWSYSNSGYVLLGAVVEKVTGMPWQAAMHARLLQPLAMQRTRYADDAALTPGRVSGYTTDRRSGDVRNATYISMTMPAAAGALESTADDLHRWMHALAHGHAIGAAGFERMTAPSTASPTGPYRYGLGLYLWNVRGTAMLGHTGQINGFASFLGYLPGRDTTIVVLANDDTFDARTFGRRLAAIVLGEPYADVAAVPQPAEALAALAGAYREDAGMVRTVSLRDGVLHAQRSGGNAVPLQVTAEGHLHFVPDELSRFVPVRNASGEVIRLDYFENGDGPPRPLPRIADAPTR